MEQQAGQVHVGNIPDVATPPVIIPPAFLLVRILHSLMFIVYTYCCYYATIRGSSMEKITQTIVYTHNTRINVGLSTAIYYLEQRTRGVSQNANIMGNVHCYDTLYAKESLRMVSCGTE
jgi:hypothetical protein